MFALLQGYQMFSLLHVRPQRGQFGAKRSGTGPIWHRSVVHAQQLPRGATSRYNMASATTQHVYSGRSGQYK